MHRRDIEASTLPHLHMAAPFLTSTLPPFCFCVGRQDLIEEERESVNNLRQLDPEIDQAYLFVRQFVQMMRTRTGENLDAWLLASSGF